MPMHLLPLHGLEQACRRCLSGWAARLRGARAPAVQALVRGAVLWVWLVGASGWAAAQGPAKPMPAGKSPPPPVSRPAGPAGLPASGAGYHSPQSPFAPIREREGFVSWKMLSQVQTQPGPGQMIVTLPPAAKALNGQRVRLQGFMMPLDVGTAQRHFLFTAIPPTCSFCIPAGPEGLVEVKSAEPVPYGTEAIELEGVWQVLQDDPLGLYYRLTEARVLRKS
ncbi:MAG: DUF3299 domain-containing protein [Burkholderiaceae bacterium]|nr:MAG: DUF3299 domain-containing protein [Burkholderiaceae bacterium]